MTAKIFTFIFCLYQIFVLTDSINVQCLYRYSAFVKVYKCIVQNDLSIESLIKAHINTTSGIHEPDVNRNDVTVIYAEFKTIQFFPIGLEKFFPNIDGIFIRSGQLKEIHQSDLKPFPKLVNLDLYQNDIRVIEKDLFMYNPKLVEIDLSYNKIVYIDSNVFNNLNSLASLYLSYNSCINRYAYNNAKDLNETIRFAVVKCKYPDYLNIENKLKILEDNPACSSSENFPEFKQNLEKVKNETITSKFSNFFENRIKSLLEYGSQDTCTTKNETNIVDNTMKNSTNEVDDDY